MKLRLFGVLGLLLLGAAACEDALPTSTEGGLVPIDPRTFEIRLPIEEFVTSTSVLGGFGRVSSLGLERVANQAEGGFEARTLVRFSTFPRIANVRLADGSFELDTLLTYVGGRVVIRFDSVTSVLDDSARIEVFRIEEAWDPVTATWERAIDSVGQTADWSEPGAGGFPVLGTATFEPASSDSIVISVDSLTMASWADTLDGSRGLRIATLDPGADLEIRQVALRIDARPSVRTDTLVELTTGTRNSTFIYSPEPPAPAGNFRVGGAPGWRTVFRIELPETVDPPAELCAEIDCPLTLDPERVNFAALNLTSTEVSAPFAPRGAIGLNAREVFAPDRLPRSPLGPPRAGVQGLAIEPGAFRAGGARAVTVPVTNYIRDLLRGETNTGAPVSSVLALLAALEPQSVTFAEFSSASQGETAPFLRIIVTLGTQRGLP